MATIDLDVTTPLSPDDAFRAWTDPAILRSWWWPMFPDTTYEVDAVEGGAFRIESADAGFGCRGEFLIVAPGERLGFSWVWITSGVDADVTDRVIVRFTRDGDDTVVQLSHEALDVDEVDGLTEGWRGVLDRLGALTELPPAR